MRHAARLAAPILLMFAAAVPFAASAVHAQAPDAKALLAAQREALAPFAYMDGVWRGDAWTMLPTGGRHEVIQTERIGPFLDGAVKVMEGRGYDADGTVSFNALGILSFDPMKKAYTIRSYAQGRSGDFTVTPTADGFVWEIEAGPMTIRYTGTVKDGTWHEVGDRIMPGGEPVRFFEMTLKRVGDTTWPAGDPVPMK